MEALATAGDVTAAMGLGHDASVMSEAQLARIEVLLAKVSRQFRREAERAFTPGTYTQQLKLIGNSVRLEEKPDTVEEVTILGVGAVTGYTVSGCWLVFDNYTSDMVGATVEVTYTWERAVPADVVASVADIVARNMAVDPRSAVAQSTLLSTQDYRQDVAAWASSGVVGMNADDIALARTYRYPLPPRIVVRP